MLVPIKQMILEFSGINGNNPVGFKPMTATGQKKDLTPSSQNNKGVNPDNNASLHEAKTQSTQQLKPNDLTKKLILNNQKAAMQSK